MSEGRRFSEVVNWETHIEPYRLVQFIAGVGSGKNYWVEHNLMQKKRVLLITSRKAKVKETSHKLGIASKPDLKALDCRCCGKLLESEARKYNSCVLNNSHIETYWKHMFNPNDERTFLWKYFDVIVVDEAHSLATDASFSDAPFHLYSFLNYVYKQKCVKLIFMTATPAPILDIIHATTKKDRHLWDFTNECINIEPRRIDIDTQENIILEIADIYKQGGSKVIYFVNYVSKIKIIMDKLIAMGIPESKIAISYSKNSKGTSFSTNIIKSKRRVENYLKAHEDLPNDIFIFISTSRNKEGINIDNPKFKWYMYVESHYNDECNQMWGRARSGLEKFTIDFNARQYQKIYCVAEPNYLLSINAIDSARNTLEEWCEKRIDKYKNCEDTHKKLDYNELEKCIRSIEERLDFVRYDIIKHDFIIYKEKVIGCKNHATNTSNFREYVKIINGQSGVSVSAPFGKIKCRINTSVFNALKEPPKLNYSDVKKKLKQYFETKGFINNAIMSEYDLENLRNYLFSIGIRQPNGKMYRSINSALKAYGYECYKGHHKGDLAEIRITNG